MSISSRKLDITVRVSYVKGDYQFEFKVDGHVDKNGEITVKGMKDEAVSLEFSVEKGAQGITEVEFLGDATDSIVVGDAGDTRCPPAPGTQFDGPVHVAGNRKTLKVRDKKTVAGDFPYALWFRVIRTNGTVDIACCDPMIINNFD